MSIYELSYNDILSLPKNIKDVYLNEFLNLVKDVPKSIYNASRKLGHMLELAELEKESLISDYVFPGREIIYYPNVRRVVSKCSYTCPVSGMICSKGTETVLYKPFIYIPKENLSYVLEKAIRAHYYHEDFFPRTIKEFDDFMYKIEHSYELNLETYYSFYTMVGDLKLRKLKRR